VIQRTVQMVDRQASFHDVDIRLELGADLPPIEIDARQIQQAILNLLINARDAMDSRGSITVATLDDDDGRRVVVRVEDSGPGIPEDLRARIVEPFFSTKGEQGNGLGLPAVISVMDQHGGCVEIGDAAGGGARFDLCFPAIAHGTGG
jgi:signal transduction histidine kinase